MFHVLVLIIIKCGYSKIYYDFFQDFLGFNWPKIVGLTIAKGLKYKIENNINIA